MSVASLVGEIQKLRREVTELSNRVLVLEAQLGEHSERGITSPSPITVNYSAGFPVGPLPPFPTFAGGETQSLPASLAPTTPPRSTARSTPPGSVSAYTEEERRAAAVEVGQFLRRSLNGERRGQSGRSRVNLPSVTYLLCRDLQGNLFDPVQVHHRFETLRPLVKQGGYCGNAVFVGLPSLWEARVATEAAGLRWPIDG